MAPCLRYEINYIQWVKDCSHVVKKFPKGDNFNLNIYRIEKTGGKKLVAVHRHF